MTCSRLRAFTLVELLVVVAVITVLLAMLTPAMDSAVYTAEKVRCLSNQRTLVHGCIVYATDNRAHWPYWPNNQEPSAYDWRTPWTAAATAAAGFGQLPGLCGGT